MVMPDGRIVDLGGPTEDPTGYDLVANSTRLGVEGTVQLIRSAIRTKQQFAEMAEPPAAAGLDDFAA